MLASIHGYFGRVPGYPGHYSSSSVLKPCYDIPGSYYEYTLEIDIVTQRVQDSAYNPVTSSDLHTPVK